MFLLVCILGLGCSPVAQPFDINFNTHTMNVAGSSTPFDTAISLALAGPVLTVSLGIHRNSFE